MPGADLEKRLEELFQLASVLPPEERDACIERHCGENPELEQKLRALLQQDDGGTNSFLGRGLWSPAKTDSEHVGPYRLIELLGEGGMGTVHLAEQETPIRRKVALKRVKLGLLTDDVAARFDIERDALARMDHPGIATIYDAGVTDTGIPYFVMEYVPGLPLTSYCTNKALDLEQRLELFILVCEAVQHAHQKGIVHRDLKPTNLLVRDLEGVPVPKVIDFGVARAISGPQQGDASLTQGGAIGTLSYMSPEQADPQLGEVDTRTDVYSLGVVLYELITGRLPFETDQDESAGILDALRALSEDEPTRPSKRTDSTTGLKLTNDLDWIVGKAMEKDRTRRYASVSEFAADAKRILACEPVSAGPPSATYRAERFARRHPVALGLGTLLALSLIGGTFGSLRGMNLAQAAEEEAQTLLVEARHQRANARAITDFLQRGLFLIGDEKLNAIEILDRSRLHVEALFSGRPAEEAAVRTALGRSYLAQGANRRARDELLKSLTILDSLEEADDLDLFTTLDGLLQAIRRIDGLEAAEPYAVRAFALARNRLGADYPTLVVSLDAIGTGAEDAGALQSLLGLLDKYPTTQLQDENSFMLGRTLMEVSVRLVLSDSELAADYLVRLETRARELLPPEDVRFLNFLWYEANVYLLPGREDSENALRLAEELHQLTRQFLPQGDWLRLDSRRVLGLAHAISGDPERAEQLLIDLRRDVDGIEFNGNTRQLLAGQALDQFLHRLERSGELESFLSASWQRWNATDRRVAWWPLLIAAPTARMTQSMKQSLGSEADPAQRGMLYVRQGRNEEAALLLDGKGSASAQLFRLLALARLGKRDEARSMLKALRASLTPALQGLLSELEAEL